MLKIDPRINLLLALGFIITLTILPHGEWLFYGVLFAILLFSAVITKTNLPWIFKRSLLAIPFMLVIVPTIFTMPGNELARFNLLFISIAPTQEGLILVGSVVVKSWLSTLAVATMLNLNSFHQIMTALEYLKVPTIVIHIALSTYRYLYLIQDEAQRMLVARKARTISSSHLWPLRSWRFQIQTFSGMVGILFIRSLIRSERVHHAMLARGYTQVAIALPQARPGNIGIAILVSSSGLLVGLTVTAYLI